MRRDVCGASSVLLRTLQNSKADSPHHVAAFGAQSGVQWHHGFPLWKIITKLTWRLGSGWLEGEAGERLSSVVQRFTNSSSGHCLAATATGATLSHATISQ